MKLRRKWGYILLLALLCVSCASEAPTAAPEDSAPWADENSGKSAETGVAQGDMTAAQTREENLTVTRMQDFDEVPLCPGEGCRCCALNSQAAAESVFRAEKTDEAPGESGESQKEKMTVAQIPDTEEILINPGKGFVFLGYMDLKKYRQDFLDIISVGYNRFNWCSIEPEEGEYNWEKIDDYVEFYRERGKQFSFGVMCANTSSDEEYVTPEWVFDAGAEGKRILTGDGNIQVIPNWEDPVFLEKLNDFTTALADRYDGSPDIAYIDIRSYGNWGEQHTYKIEDAWPDITADQLKEWYIEPYIDRFKHTQLVAPYGKEEYDETYMCAIEQGVTIRRDGIVTYSDGSEGKLVYGKLPAIFEYPSSYLSDARESGDWRCDEVKRVVETGAPTYLQLDQDMYDSNKAFYNQLANRIGYYFRFREAEYQGTVEHGESCRLQLTFRNDGVAPIYAPVSLKIGLLDQDYRLVQSYALPDDPGEWMPDTDTVVEAELKFNNEKEGTLNGEYILAAGLFADDKDEKPDYKMGSAGATDDNWYVFGAVTVQR